MRRYFCLILLAFSICLPGCETNGPKAALDQMATALEKNNPSQFLAEMNLPAYAANYVKNLTESQPALNSLNDLGNMLGLGTIDSLLGGILDAQARMKTEFERGVASGELVAQCGQALSPDCPWYPASLRNAQIIELGPDAAIARITSPTRIISWLAMRKYGENWQVVGRAVMENDARAMAEAANQEQPAPTDPKNPAKTI